MKTLDWEAFCRETAEMMGGDPATIVADRDHYKIKIETRSGGMNDPREILCEACGECAVTYTGNVDSLDRRVCVGECGHAGVVDIDQDDEGHVRARFLPRETHD